MVEWFLCTHKLNWNQLERARYTHVHYVDCRETLKIPEKNRIEYATYENALAAQLLLQIQICIFKCALAMKRTIRKANTDARTLEHTEAILDEPLWIKPIILSANINIRLAFHSVCLCHFLRLLIFIWLSLLLSCVPYIDRHLSIMIVLNSITIPVDAQYIFASRSNIYIYIYMLSTYSKSKTVCCIHFQICR